MLPAPPVVDHFKLAWNHAEKAGLGHPGLQVLPDPVLARTDATAAWALARAHAEVVEFQRQLGRWMAPPMASPKALAQALAGLRRAAQGPAWWRRLVAPVRAWNLAHWHGELADASRQVAQECRRLEHAVAALQGMTRGLDAWLAWAQTHVPDPARVRWEAHATLAQTTLAVLGQRLGLRLQQARAQVDGLAQAGVLVEAVRAARGLAVDQAWLEAGRQASRIQAGLQADP